LIAFWKYRVGDHLIIGSIDDKVFRVLAVKISHWREAYR